MNTLIGFAEALKWFLITNMTIFVGEKGAHAHGFVSTFFYDYDCEFTLMGQYYSTPYIFTLKSRPKFFPNFPEQQDQK